MVLNQSLSTVNNTVQTLQLGRVDVAALSHGHAARSLYFGKRPKGKRMASMMAPPCPVSPPQPSESISITDRPGGDRVLPQGAAAVLWARVVLSRSLSL